MLTPRLQVLTFAGPLMQYKPLRLHELKLQGTDPPTTLRHDNNISWLAYSWRVRGLPEVAAISFFYQRMFQAND